MKSLLTWHPLGKQNWKGRQWLDWRKRTNGAFCKPWLPVSPLQWKEVYGPTVSVSTNAVSERSSGSRHFLANCLAHRGLRQECHRHKTPQYPGHREHGAVITGEGAIKKHLFSNNNNNFKLYSIRYIIKLFADNKKRALAARNNHTGTRNVVFYQQKRCQFFNCYVVH